MEALLRSFYILLTLIVGCKQLALAQDTKEFIYHGFNGTNFILNGMANVHSNGLLELTNTSKEEIGHAFFPLPFKFNTSSPNTSQSLSFSTSFVFAMVPEAPTLGGHGIAFTISPSTDFWRAAATQYLGLFNSTSLGLSSNHVLAIELDTVENPEFKDINGNHVGIDINNLTSIQSAPAGYFPENMQKKVSLELNSGKPMQAWIDYHEEEKLLNVTLASIESRKPERPLLSTSIDLSLVLLDSMYVGFSSSTGSVASYHYILGWSFNKSGQVQNLDASKLPSLPTSRESGSRPQLKIILPVMTAIAIAMAISLSVYIKMKKYEEIREDWEQQYGPQRFSYTVLYKSTKGFKDREILGSGGFGRVYKGVLPSSNLQVAIKRVSHGSSQGMKEFVAEIASMGRLRHRNLVQLLGYCRRKQELFLVYDYMANGSLDKFLFSSEKPKLDWIRRYQVIKGVASALLYLHEEWEQVVLHRDVKASNVLLDAEFNGRLGDFGLAKFYDHGSVPQTTHVVGTVGYLAPELTSTGRATTSSDVFSFGIFMLEVACGRKPVEPRRHIEEVILVEWVLESYRIGAILGTSDPSLEGNYVAEEMELVLKLGLLCAHRTPTSRPSMRQLVQYLDKNATLPEITAHGAGIGLLLHSHEVSPERTSPVPVSTDNCSLYSLPETETNSILYSGR